MITKPSKPVPADFAEIAPHRTRHQLCVRYQAQYLAVDRWLAETSLEPLKDDRRAAPPEFAELAPRYTAHRLGVMLKACHKTVRRWAQELGIEIHSNPIPREPKPRKPRAPRVRERKAPVLRQKYWRGAPKSFDHRNVDMSVEGRAADYLRHIAPVYRCDERGRFLATGKFWRTGNVLMTTDELIDRAMRKGFNPDAWKALAA